MTQILPNNMLDDLPLQKFSAKEKIGKVLDLIQTERQKPLIRTASSDETVTAMVTMFNNMLSLLNLKANTDSQGLIEKLASKEELTKSAAKKSASRSVDIKIASKAIKDSHYQIDLSKDLVVKGGSKIFMVSCYGRDAYLGRYLVKRNFYFTADREAAADEAYDEIYNKMNALKERYYSGILAVSGVSTQMRKILDGVVSEIASEEDELATNIKR